MKTTGGTAKTERVERDVIIKRVDHGREEIVATVQAQSLRKALEGYFKDVLAKDGHHGPLYVGNHLCTLTKFFTKAEFVAYDPPGLDTRNAVCS